MPTPLSDLLTAALRVAGIIMRPNWVLSTDMAAELIPALNRMLGSWNIDGSKIFTSGIQTFPLTSGVKTYTIGPGGDFDTARPNYYSVANILYPTGPVVRQPVRILRNDDEWASIRVQDIPGAPAWVLYPDMAFPLTTLYLYPQPPAGYTLELYTWQALSTYAAITDSVVVPDGYEEAIVWNLGVRAAAMYPHDSKLSPDARDQARRSLRAVQQLNAKTPALCTDQALSGWGGGGSGSSGNGSWNDAAPWLDGGII